MDTAERLIAGTQELLWERGYIGASPKEIQRRAGAGQGSMYHHFTGKPDLALAAIRRTAETKRAAAHTHLSAPGTATERITGYLRAEREVLRGCPMGRLTADPDIIADPDLRRPVDEMFDWLRHELADVLTQGQRHGELSADLDPAALAATIAATLQGGYVLARAAAATEPFDQAVDGLLDLLAHAGVPAPPTP